MQLSTRFRNPSRSRSSKKTRRSLTTEKLETRITPAGAIPTAIDYVESTEHFEEGQLNLIKGTGKNDKLKGTSGDDIFFGGAGKDKFKGGDGADVFAFKPIDTLTGSTKKLGLNDTDITLDHEAFAGANVVRDFDSSEGDKVLFYSAGGNIHTVTMEIKGNHAVLTWYGSSANQIRSENADANGIGSLVGRVRLKNVAPNGEIDLEKFDPANDVLFVTSETKFDLINNGPSGLNNEFANTAQNALDDVPGLDPDVTPDLVFGDPEDPIVIPGEEIVEFNLDIALEDGETIEVGESLSDEIAI